MIKDLRATDPELAGPYRLAARLGAGGMGQVYLARSASGRLLAIKLIRPELADEPGFRARLGTAIAAARNVRGTFTAAVVDADADAEPPWIATTYVPGPSLAAAVESEGPLPDGSLFALAAGLAEALAEIHRAGLVHRDLKPSNVLLASGGPRVTDFGLSAALDRSAVSGAGSAGFLSPEQARGRDEIGPASDVFSLGAVLAYAATGDGPFGAGPAPALLYRVVNEDGDLIRVPAKIRPLVERCLAKDPAARPTPAGLLAALSGEAGPATGDWPAGDWPAGDWPAGDWPPANLTEVIRQYDAVTQPPAPAPGAQAAAASREVPPAVAPPSGRADSTGRPRAGRWPPALTASAAAAIVVVAVVAALAALSPTSGKPVRQTITRVSGATQVSCQDQGSVRSSTDGAGVTYSVVNSSGAVIQIWFLDSGGAGVLKAAVGPGGSFGRSVPIGQYWMVANSAGGCLSVFRITGSGSATVSLKRGAS